jgi:hypothetical protein
LLEVVNYNYTSTPYNLSVQILNKIKLSSDIQLANREELFIKDICKRVSKSKSVLYVLEDGNNIIGLFSMSATNVKDQPSAQIDYIFVNKLYRGKSLEVLENYKPFRYLISLAVILAEQISKEMGLRYIVLSPDNNDLKEKYKQVDFQILDDDWMYLKIPNSSK